MPSLSSVFQNFPGPLTPLAWCRCSRSGVGLQTASSKPNWQIFSKLKWKIEHCNIPNFMHSLFCME